MKYVYAVNRTWLHNPCVVGGPQQGGRNQKWLHKSGLLGGARENAK